MNIFARKHTYKANKQNRDRLIDREQGDSSG